MSREQTSRRIKNPWPRLALSAALTVWAGSNMWTARFHWTEIYQTDPANRFVGLFLTIMLTLVPLVVAIYLAWTVVVGPDDPQFNAKQTATAPGRGGQGKKR